MRIPAAGVANRDTMLRESKGAEWGMANTKTDQQFKLQDGRMLGYAECWTLADAIPNCNARFYEK